MSESSNHTPEKVTPFILNLMNETYSREAGRWCEACNQYGSHHTDKHEFFIAGLLRQYEFSKQN